MNTPKVAIQLSLAECAHALRRLIERETRLARVVESTGESTWAAELRQANAVHQQELAAVQRKIDETMQLDAW